MPWVSLIFVLYYVARFQHKEYADVTVVQTEKKGFGLRAESQIPR